MRSACRGKLSLYAAPAWLAVSERRSRTKKHRAMVIRCPFLGRKRETGLEPATLSLENENDKNSFFDGASVGKMGLCVKKKMRHNILCGLIGTPFWLEVA